MRARIINKNNHVSKVVTEYRVNNQTRKHSEYIVTEKPIKARTTYADRVVFTAMHEVGCDWATVSNYLSDRMSDNCYDALQKEIDRHTV